MIDPQYQSTPSTVGDGLSAGPRIDNKRRFIVTGEAAAPVPVTPSGSAPVGGGITWGAIQTVAMTGSSKTFVPANASRKAVAFWSPAANAAAAYDLSGGTVALASGMPLFAGGSPTVLTGAECPVTAITAIGTNAQNLYYSEGT